MLGRWLAGGLMRRVRHRRPVGWRAGHAPHGAAAAGRPARRAVLRRLLPERGRHRRRSRSATRTRIVRKCSRFRSARTTSSSRRNSTAVSRPRSPPVVPTRPMARRRPVATAATASAASSPSPSPPVSRATSSGRCGNRGQAFSVPGRSRTGAYSAAVADGDGIDSAAPPLQAERPGRPRSDGNQRRPAAGVSRRSRSRSRSSIDDDSKRERRSHARQGARTGAPGAERDLVQALGPGPGGVQQRRRTASRNSRARSTTTATFKQPGDYVIRGRVDNFGRVDTSAGNQCCWTNGYVKVTVK